MLTKKLLLALTLASTLFATATHTAEPLQPISSEPSLEQVEKLESCADEREYYLKQHVALVDETEENGLFSLLNAQELAQFTKLKDASYCLSQPHNPILGPQTLSKRLLIAQARKDSAIMSYSLIENAGKRLRDAERARVAKEHKGRE